MSHLLFNAVASCILYPTLCCVFELTDNTRSEAAIDWHGKERNRFTIPGGAASGQTGVAVFTGHLSVTAALDLSPHCQT